MATNERTIDILEKINEAIITLNRCRKELKYHIGQQKRQMNK